MDVDPRIRVASEFLPPALFRGKHPVMKPKDVSTGFQMPNVHIGPV